MWALFLNTIKRVSSTLQIYNHEKEFFANCVHNIVAINICTNTCYLNIFRKTNKKT